MKSLLSRVVLVAAILGCCVSSFLAYQQAQAADQAKKRVFEVRTYYTENEKMAEAMHARFRDHTCKLFKKHGMDLIGFWVPENDKTKLIYVLAYPNREAAKKSWQDFGNDPDWKKVYEESHKNAGGKIVTKVDSVYMNPTDYSEIQ